MNTSTADKTGTIQPEALLKSISADDIRHFAKSKNISLTAKDLAQIDKALQRNTPLFRLNQLIADFNDAFMSHALSPGLNTQQLNTLKSLSAELNQYKTNGITKDTPLPILKRVVQLQKEMTKLDRTNEWWKINLQSLDKTSVWDSLVETTRIMYKNQGALQDEINDKLNKLDSIREEWEHSKPFNHLSSENLLAFYNDFIIELEKVLQEYIKNNTHMTPIIRDYLQVLKGSLEKIKINAIFAMNTRLNCADYYKHIECDDIINHTAHRIQDLTGITLLHTEKAPDARCDLQPYLFTEFSHLVNQHVGKIKNLQFNTHYAPPKEWEDFFLTQNGFNTIIHHPIFIYFAHTFTLTLDNPRELTYLTAYVAENRCSENSMNTLNRHRVLLKVATDEYKKMKGFLKLREPNPIKDLIDYQQKKFDLALTQINLQIESEMIKKFAEITSMVFTEKSINENTAFSFIRKINNLLDFQHNFIEQSDFHYSDIILALTRSLIQRIAQQKKITFQHLDNMKMLISLFYSGLSSENALRLKNAIDALPAFMQQIKHEKPEIIAHLILHHLEIPLLAEDSFATATKRHEMIANEYHETWDKTPISDEQGYIKKVVTPLIAVSPMISLSNFYLNETKQWVGQKSDQQLVEKLMFERIGNIFLIKEYLHSGDVAINENALSQLLERSKNYFTDPNLYDQMRKLIIQAITELTLSDCIEKIKAKKDPDILLINRLNRLCGINLFATICQDDSFIQLIKTFIELYDGSQPTLSSLLTKFDNLTTGCHCDQYIIAYARKRLGYIKSAQSATLNDADFFAHFSYIPEINELFQDTKKYFQPTIASILQSKEPSYASNALINLFGELKQLQQHHANLVSRCISKTEPFQTTWLGQYLLENAELTDDDYSEFFGKDAISSLLLQLDQVLIDIMKADKDPEQINSMNVLIKRIDTIQPLAHFYSMFSTDKEKIIFFERINEVAKKLELQDKLKSSLPANLSMHGNIISLINTLKLIQANELLTQDNIFTYVETITRDIFDKLFTPNHIINYDTSVIIYDLLMHLVNDQLKLLMTQACQNELVKNPYWLTLINHLGEANALKSIEVYLGMPEGKQAASANFITLFQFSKRYHLLKKQFKLYLQNALLAEASGMSKRFLPANTVSITQELAILSDQRLLSLWRLTTQKLTSPIHHELNHADHARQLIKLIHTITSHILQRARYKKSILTDFIAELPVIDTIYRCFSHSEIATSSISPLYCSFWTSFSEKAETLKPLLSITDRVKTLQMILALEKHTPRIISKQDQSAFSSYLNSVDIMHSQSVFVSLKKLQTQLMLIEAGKAPLSSISPLLRMEKNIPHAYVHLIRKLDTIMKQNLLVRNDPYFSAAAVKKVFAFVKP